MYSPCRSMPADTSVDWSKPLEGGPIKIDISADERKLAEQDAEMLGLGFLVDGKHIHPSRVIMLTRKNDQED